jgi:hypothetical protein
LATFNITHTLRKLLSHLPFGRAVYLRLVPSLTPWATARLSLNFVVRAIRGAIRSSREKRTPPIALAARDKYDLAPFVGEPIERLLDC